MGNKRKISLSIIEDIFNEPYKCKCGKMLDITNIEYGDIEGAFKCSCGEHYMLGIDEGASELITYTYEYNDGFIINKEKLKPSLDRENKKYIYDRDKIEKESIIFKVGKRGLNKNLKSYYIDINGRSESKIAENFFNKFSINDFRDIVESFKRLSLENDVKPNYGELIEPFCCKRNMMRFKELFQLIFTDNFLELLVKEGFGYLILIDPVQNIERIKEAVEINKDGTTLNEILGVPKKTLTYMREKKLGIEKIGQIHDFSKTRGFKEFNILFIDGKCTLDRVATMTELLESGYSAEKLYAYLVKIAKMEKMSVDRMATYLNDLRHMCTDMELDFRPYSKNVVLRHDRLQEDYNIQKEASNDIELANTLKGVEVVQVKGRFYCKLLKTVEEFRNEGRDQRNCVLSYVKRTIKGEVLILSIRDRENLEKPIVTVEIKAGRIVQAKTFANKGINDEIREYLLKLGYRNNWRVARM